MNETINNLIDRRSVSAYTEKAIPEEAMELILKAGTYAPSGMGRQPVVFVAVEKKEVRDRLSRMNAAIMGTDSDPFYGAPAVIVVLADRSVPTCLYDGSLAMGNLMTAAHSLGIDSCWIHRAKEEFDSPEGKALLEEWGIHGDYEGIGHCILGYRSCEYPEAKPRKEGTVIRI